jgi:hypothetical protein
VLVALLLLPMPQVQVLVVLRHLLHQHPLLPHPLLQHQLRLEDQ